MSKKKPERQNIRLVPKSTYTNDHLCDYEYYGIREHKFDIEIDEMVEDSDSENYKTCGSLSFYQIDSEKCDSSFHALDIDAETFVYASLIEDDWEFNDKAKLNFLRNKGIDLEDIHGCFYALNKIEVNKEYRGLNIAKDAFDIALSVLNVTFTQILLLVYPIQFKYKEGIESELDFLEARSKLINIYKDWGFVSVSDDDDENYFMINDMNLL